MTEQAVSASASYGEAERPAVHAAFPIALPSFTYLVERVKIQEFASAIGDPNPLYYDIDRARACGYRDIPAPPTFPVAIDMWTGNDLLQVCRTLDLPAIGILHVEQEYTYTQELCAGDTVHGYPSILSIRNKAGMILLMLETELRDLAGSRIVLGSFKLMMKKQ
ncbi:MaoC family dehydratase N-terminal domain-containing protein [Paenibacillus oenotherae]|uniref:MaoC family dehydratase N-terminal domain-containing protein n=1 Tax=Paenibacillus oenotherae TaxID=1435645 RepID=A0ABS7DBI9_9BACL|nr:MaoC family dehydratase N-terminal domain-containing protein [Paenibacillus oenotherae]MBW7477302.1 MaoC family dehydratase N-terminal domain-containing protein [Paenibacillus oenotherae]